MQNSKKQHDFDDSFYKLAREVTAALEKNKDGTSQQQQVEELMEAERLFKAAILSRKAQAREIYKKFLQKICIQNKNILSARPYFREKAVSFSKHITPAIKANDIETLQSFDINYQLIKFIRDNYLGPFPPKAELLYQRVYEARTKLIQNNMPLAINRAKLFYRKVPRSHLNLLDMIEICAMGLAAGVDKYCGKYTPVFRSVCIGRMVGNLIDAYSETVLHFYPSDRRILYKANSLRSRQGISDIADLTKAVNDSFTQDELEGKTIPRKNITVSELASLMAAASTMSADATINDEGFGVYHVTPDATPNIEETMVERETNDQVTHYASQLPLMHRKVLLLKGIRLP